MVEQSETAAVNHFRRGGTRRIFLLLILLLVQPLLVGILLLVKASRRSRMGRAPGLRDGRDGRRLLLGRARRNVGVKVARRSGRDVRLALRIHVNSSAAAAAVADRHVGARFRLRFVKIKRQRFISGRGVVSLFVIVVEGGRRRIAGRFAIVLTNVLILPGDDRYIPSCDKKNGTPPPNTQIHTQRKDNGIRSCTCKSSRESNERIEIFGVDCFWTQ